MRALISALFLLPAVAWAQFDGLGMGDPAFMSLVGEGAEAAPSTIFSEDWNDGAGGSRWSTVSGTPEFTYATPLEGVYSVRLGADAISSPAFTAQNAVRIEWMMRIQTLPSSETPIFVDGDFSLQLKSTGGLRIVHGAATESTVANMATATTYYMWLHYDATSNLHSVEFQTTDVETQSGNNYASNTDGTGSSQVDGILLQALSAPGAVIILDRIEVYAE